MGILDRLEQLCVEDQYNKLQTKEFILQDIGDSLNPYIDKATGDLYEYFDGKYYESKNKRLDAFWECNDFDLTSIILEVIIAVLPHTTPVNIQTIVGKVKHHFKYENPLDAIKTASEVIAVIAKSDLYDIRTGKYTKSGMIEVISNFQLEDHTLQKINDLGYLPPMLCKPNKIYNNYQSAYLSKNDSVLLGKGTFHIKPLNLDVINYLNNIPLELDQRILQLEEESKKPLNTPEKKKNFELMRKSSRTIYNEIGDKQFHFEWKYDSRGRFYSCGYHINLQSTEYKKALINLANKEVIQL